MNADEEKIRKLSDEDELGLELLYDFLSNLIVQFKQYGISTKDLVSISKGLLIVARYDTIEFEGSIDIATGQHYAEGGSDYISLTITSTRITLSHYGSIYSEGEGSDSFEEVLLIIYGDHKYRGDISTQFETWNDAFFIHFPEQDLFTEDTINFD